MQLSESQIDDLIRQRSISGEWPWTTNDESVIDKFIDDIIADIRRKACVQDKTAFDHYGSGYASYVDCWIYRPNDEFRLHAGDNYCGLVVLFSRLSEYYVLGEGAKCWKGATTSSYLPSFELVDQIEHPAVVELERLVSPVLSSRGLCRLRTSDLFSPLPSGVRVPTILADPPLRHFDALFYWED